MSEGSTSANKQCGSGGTGSGEASPTKSESGVSTVRAQAKGSGISNMCSWMSAMSGTPSGVQSMIAAKANGGA